MHSFFKFAARILALISVVFGAFFLIMEISTTRDFGGVLLAIAFALPGAWWFYCESRDKRAQETKMKRRWGRVSISALVLFVVGGLALPDTAPSETDDVKSASVVAPTSTSTSSEPTSTASTTSEMTSTTSSTTSSSATTSTSAAVTTSTTASFEPTEEWEDEESHDRDRDRRQSVWTPEPQPIVEYTPTPTPAPQQFVQQPVAPAPAAYYQNCAAVRAAGAAPLYAGQPGYEAPRLDRDYDGVACE